MGNWIGLGFFVVLIVAIAVGLRALSKPQKRTSEEFERNAAEGTTMLGASMNALNELMNPPEAKAREVIVQMKGGRFQKKKREGKVGGDGDNSGQIDNESGGNEQNS